MSLMQTAIRGGQWIAFSMVCTTLLQLLKLAVLARFLAPEEFGLIAIVLIIFGFSQAFADMGISNALVHRQKISHIQLSSLYWLNIVSGITLAAIVSLASPLISRFYQQPQLTHLTIAISSIFIITAAGQQFRMLCQKEMQFGAIAIVTCSSELVASILAIWLAWRGFGVWALVLSMILAAISNALGFIAVGVRRHHRPAFVFRHKEIKEFYGFGLYQMGERSINYLSANIDKILIGKFVGMTALGLYNMAWQLITFPLSRINPIVNTVAFPAYAKLQSDIETRSRYYAASVRLLSLIAMPLLAFLFFFAPEVVLVAFGVGWEKTAFIVQILTIVGVSKALGNPGGALVLSMGRPDVGFWWNVAWCILITIGILVAVLLEPTLESAAYTLLVLSLIAGFIWHYVVARIAKLHYWPIAALFAKILVVSFAIGFLVDHIAMWLSLTSVISKMVFGTLTYGLLYFAYLALSESEFIMRILRSK